MSSKNAMNTLNESSAVLITGGTGSFGKAFTKFILNKYPGIKRFVIYSRDELKQYEMSQIFSDYNYPGIRYFIGDIRDRNRFKRACEGIDIVVHAAALKQVPSAEYNPDEYIHTNIGGAENVIHAALDTNVKVVVALSTDKAAAPINLYGATKLCSDKLFISANNIKGNRNLRFSVVRYGNVMGSRGSVIPFFLEKRKEGHLPITHGEMTRFNISLEDGAEMVYWAINNAIGGELFVPKLPSYKLITLAEAIAPNCRIQEIGIRPGEKIHEEMITASDSYNTIDIGKYYAILPSFTYNKQKYLDYYNAKSYPPGKSYYSGGNDQWLNVEDLRMLIKKHIDQDFKPL